MSDNPRCQTCVFWHQNAQRKLPEIREYGSFFGIRYRRETEIEEIMRDVIKEKNAAGQCQRFPKSRQTDRGYVCGEFAARKDAPHA